MRQLVIVFLLGLLSCSRAASVERRTTHTNTHQRSSPAEIGARFENEGFHIYPELKEPTDEEWINLIKESAVPNHHTLLHNNQSGSFNNSDGSMGTWEARSSYTYWKENEDSLRVSGISVNFFLLNNKSHTVSVSLKEGVRTRILPGHVLEGDVLLSASFYKNGDKYVRYGESLAYTMGELVRVNPEEFGFSTHRMSLSNVSNHFTLDTGLSDGWIKTHENLGALSGMSHTYQMPLDSNQHTWKQMTKDPVAVAQLLKTANDFSSDTHFFGDFTIGKKGVYRAGSNTQLSDSSKIVFNSTSQMHGNYSIESSKESDIGVQEQYLISGFMASLVNFIY